MVRLEPGSSVYVSYFTDSAVSWWTMKVRCQGSRRHAKTLLVSQVRYPSYIAREWTLKARICLMSSSYLSFLFTGEVPPKLKEPRDSIRVVMKKQLAAYEIYTSHGLIAALCVAERRLCVVVVMRRDTHSSWRLLTLPSVAIVRACTITTTGKHLNQAISFADWKPCACCSNWYISIQGSNSFLQVLLVKVQECTHDSVDVRGALTLLSVIVSYMYKSRTQAVVIHTLRHIPIS